MLVHLACAAVRDVNVVGGIGGGHLNGDIDVGVGVGGVGIGGADDSTVVLSRGLLVDDGRRERQRIVDATSDGFYVRRGTLGRQRT